MTGNMWQYHRCLRCGAPIETPRRIWCDKHDTKADDELDALLAGGSDE